MNLKKNLILLILLSLSFLTNISMANQKEIIGWTRNSRYFVFNNKTVYDSYTMHTKDYSSRELKKFLKKNKLVKNEGRFSPDKTVKAEIKSDKINGSWRNKKFFYTPLNTAKSSLGKFYFNTIKNSTPSLSAIEYIDLKKPGSIRVFWAPDNQRLIWHITDSKTTRIKNICSDKKCIVRKININQYQSEDSQLPIIAAPVEGPRISIECSVAGFVSPLIDDFSKKISQKGYAITSIRSKYRIPKKSIIRYKKEYKSAAKDIAAQLPGESELKQLEESDSSEISITIGNSALVKNALKRKVTFDLPVHSSYIKTQEYCKGNIIGWSADSRYFAFGENRDGCCGDPTENQTITIYDIATGCSAKFYTQGASGPEGVDSFLKQKKITHYDVGMYKAFLKKHKFVKISGLNSKNKKAKAFGSSQKLNMSTSGNKLTWKYLENNDKKYPKHPLDIYFMVKSNNKTFKAGYFNVWKTVGNLGIRNRSDEIKIYWSPDSKKVVFIPKVPLLDGICRYYIIPGPTDSPRVELKVPAGTSDKKIKFIRKRLFEKNYIVVRVTKYPEKKRTSTLYYIEEFKADAEIFKKGINSLYKLKTMKKNAFSDIIFEVGEQTLNVIDD